MAFLLSDEQFKGLIDSSIQLINKDFESKKSFNSLVRSTHNLMGFFFLHGDGCVASPERFDDEATDDAFCAWLEFSRNTCYTLRENFIDLTDESRIMLHMIEKQINPFYMFQRNLRIDYEKSWQ